MSGPENMKSRLAAIPQASLLTIAIAAVDRVYAQPSLIRLCASCYGIQGISHQLDLPHIAGQLRVISSRL